MKLGTYKEALTDLQIATCKEYHSKHKLNEKNLKLALVEIMIFFHRTPKEDLYLRSYRLEGGSLIDTCADLQSR
jgi:hypothetical protein